MIVCIAETRNSEEIAVKLLLLSLANYNEYLNVVLYYPSGGESFTFWLKDFLEKSPNISLDLRTSLPTGANGWDVKAYVMKSLLLEGNESVCWIDSDIITTSSIDWLNLIPLNEVVVAEEALFGNNIDQGLRSRAWGYEPKRLFKNTLNTGVLRLSRLHLPILYAWITLLESETYKEAQALNWYDRPIHLVGDQDLFTTVLSQNDYSVCLLRRGLDILQYFGLYGYTSIERLCTLMYGVPTFVHSQGAKPWKEKYLGLKDSKRRVLNDLLVELSPYTKVASLYKNKLTKEETMWMDYTSFTGRLFKLLGFNRLALVGLPIACILDIYRLLRR